MQGFFRPLTTWIWICPSSLPAEAQGRGVGSSRLSPAVDGLGEFVQQATVTWLHLAPTSWNSREIQPRLTPYEAHVAYGVRHLESALPCVYHGHDQLLALRCTHHAASAFSLSGSELS